MESKLLQHSRGIRGAVVGNYSPPGLPSALPSGLVLDGIVGPSTTMGAVPVAPAGVALVVRPTTGGMEPVATRDPAAAARPSCVLEEMTLTMSSLATSITAVVTIPTFRVGIASFLPWMVPTKKSSSNLNAAVGLTCFFLGYGWSGLCF